jgi:hypothetical protein
MGCSCFFRSKALWAVGVNGAKEGGITSRIIDVFSAGLPKEIFIPGLMENHAPEAFLKPSM